MFRPRRRQGPLQIGVIGTSNRAYRNLDAVRGEAIVALCDVDLDALNRAAREFPKARLYRDYRKLIENPDVEAVVVSTPDHTHAVAVSQALRMDKHVYCEKPLARHVGEARRLRELASSTRAATQMGTQIHAGENYRRVVEWIQTGALGRILEVHAWVAKRSEPASHPIEILPVPSSLDYDLWLGPAAYRPYHPSYLPKTWRNWWHFGGGTLEDFGCHYMDLAFWALDLKYPSRIRAEGSPPHPDAPPPELSVRYTFESHGGGPLELYWHHGGRVPEAVQAGRVPDWKNGVLFVGEGGMLLADYQRHLLLPQSRFEGMEPPTPFIPPSVGHHQEWIDACKNGTQPSCSLAYSGLLTETVLLGNLAHRLAGTLEWDHVGMKIMGHPESRSLILPGYRHGWHL